MIKNRLKCWLLTGALFTSLFVGAQSVCPEVPDFTDLTAPWVTVTYGFTDNPFWYRGIVENRHRVITFQGEDYYTGGLLNLLPPGEDKVVKLGNEYSGDEAESITYRFIVDGNRPVYCLYLEGRERQGIMRNNRENRIDLQRIVDFNTLVVGIWK